LQREWNVDAAKPSLEPRQQRENELVPRPIRLKSELSCAEFSIAEFNFIASHLELTDQYL